MRQWTPERRLKQAQLIHTWKPWVKSTGARTQVGKEISKMNAHKHGGYDSDHRELIRLLRQCSKTLHQIKSSN